MENSLPNITRIVIEQNGFEIIKNERFVNILADYKAFHGYSMLQSIFRGIIKEGYTEKVLALSPSSVQSALSRFLGSITKIQKAMPLKPKQNDWQMAVKSYAMQFTQKHGHERDIVMYAFDCILYGIGWIDRVTCKPTELPVIAKHPKTTMRNKYASTSTNIYTPTPVSPQKTISTPIHSDVQVTNATSKVLSSRPSTPLVTYGSIVDTQFLIMKVHPENAYVFIDGVQQPVSSGVMAAELTVGNHDYEVSCVSYITKTGMVTIPADRKMSLDVKLEADKSFADVYIKTVEPHTEIWINGINYGMNVYQGHLPLGRYELEFRLEKHYTTKQTLDIKFNKPIEIKVPALTPMTGNLNVNVTPYGSKIFVNGKEVGETPLLIKDIIIGERHIRVHTVEGTEYERVIDVKENLVSMINADIKSLFFTDYSNVKIGDFFYEDGSFSHIKAENKMCVGIVFSLNTSEEEKSHGWTHGQIMSNSKSKYVHGRKIYKTDALIKYGTPQIATNNGYKIAHDDVVFQNKDYTPFLDASDNQIPLPSGRTSGWYLPCMSQLYEILEFIYGKLDFSTNKIKLSRQQIGKTCYNQWFPYCSNVVSSNSTTPGRVYCIRSSNVELNILQSNEYNNVISVASF